MSLIQEFKQFAVKGNIMDLAIAVIIGGAFGKIVSALVDKILMPPIGYLVGGVDFSRLRLVLQVPGGPGGKEEVAIGYGEFLQASFNFLIIAWAMFMVFKLVSRLQLTTPPPPAAPAPPSEEVLLLREIRDSLKKGT
jgi:large conductance mechanosensitive channel